MLTGAGAGASPTASAVISDIIDIACDRFSNCFAIKSENQIKVEFADINNHQGSYYIRINVQDISGMLAEITDIFKNNSVSVKSLIQNPEIALPSEEAKKNMQIIGITHNAKESDMKNIMQSIEKLSGVVQSPQIIRIHN